MQYEQLIAERWHRLADELDRILSKYKRLCMAAVTKISDYLVIIAGSSRMLAQAAKKAGLKALVIDLFADRDTRSYAEESLQIPSLAVEHLAPAVDYLINRYGVKELIYGSGFEYFPDSLFYLRSRLTVLGNDPDTFARLQHKSFFSALDRLRIPHPEVSFAAPVLEDDWLYKPWRRQGGLGIRRHRQNQSGGSLGYWQKFQPGEPHSALFIADGQAMRVIGFNRQWTATINEFECFVFSGVINCEVLPSVLKQRIVAWLTRLVPELGLKGLNSLDFIQDGGNSYILEINARPPASMQLYDGDLLAGHIRASRGWGLLLAGLPRQRGCSGYQIVYARQPVTIPECFGWPDSCMDLPPSGSIIGEGQPICSIITRQNKAEAVFKQLADTEFFIINKLEGFHTHALYRER